MRRSNSKSLPTRWLDRATGWFGATSHWIGSKCFFWLFSWAGCRWMEVEYEHVQHYVYIYFWYRCRYIDIHRNTRCWIFMNILSYCIKYRISVWWCKGEICFCPSLFFQKWNHLLKVFAFYEWWLSIVMDEYRIIRMIISCFGVQDIQTVLCFCNIWMCSLPRVRSRLSCIRLPREWVLLHMPNRYIVCCMTCQRIWVLVCHTPSCLLYVSLQHVLFTCHVERLHPLCMA